VSLIHLIANQSEVVPQFVTHIRRIRLSVTMRDGTGLFFLPFRNSRKILN
jgi:hypothetical protein